MKAFFLVFATAISFSTSASAISFCENLSKTEAQLNAKLEVLVVKINQSQSSDKAAGYLHQYKKVYNQLLDVQSEYEASCAQ